MIESLDVQSVSSARQVAISSLRQQAYEMIATANDHLNKFAKEHPELTAQTVKVMEWGASALHAAAYVGVATYGGPIGVASLVAVEQAIGASLEAAIEAGADHAAASASTPEEAARFREAFFQLTGKGLLVASLVGAGKGIKAVKVKFGKPQSTKKQQYKITDDNADPSLPVGSRRSQMQPLEKYHNSPGQVDDVKFSAHALDRLMERGIPPSAVKEAILYGVQTPGNVAGRISHYDAKNNITVIMEQGKVVTARYGK